MRLLVTLLCVALVLAGCNDNATQGVTDPNESGFSETENNSQNPGGDATSSGSRGNGSVEIETDGIRSEGDTIVRESDGFVYDPNHVNHYKDDANDPYPVSLRQFTCAYAAVTDHFGVLYITSRECVPESRAEQCGLLPQDVSVPHCIITGTVVSSLKGLPPVGETFEFVDRYRHRTFPPQVDDIVFTSFFSLRGLAVADAMSFVAPPVELRGAYPDGFPERSLSLPDSIDEQGSMILESDCTRATKQHIESIEHRLFARSGECDE